MLCDAARTRAVYDLVAEVLLRCCHIQTNLGKLAAWNRSGSAAPPGIAELNTPNRLPVWRADLPPAQNGMIVLEIPVGRAEFISSSGIEHAQDEQAFLMRFCAFLVYSMHGFCFCFVPGLVLTVSCGQFRLIL